MARHSDGVLGRSAPLLRSHGQPGAIERGRGAVAAAELNRRLGAHGHQREVAQVCRILQARVEHKVGRVLGSEPDSGGGQRLDVDRKQRVDG